MPLLRLIYIGLLICAAVFFWQAQHFPAAQSARDVGPSTFPQWLAGTVVVMCLVALATGWRRHPLVPWKEIALPFGVGAAMVAAIWLASIFGFFVVLPFALFCGLWLSGSRMLIPTIAFSLLMPLVAWLIFAHLLALPLEAL